MVEVEGDMPSIRTSWAVVTDVSGTLCTRREVWAEILTCTSADGVWELSVVHSVLFVPSRNSSAKREGRGGADPSHDSGPLFMLPSPFDAIHGPGSLLSIRNAMSDRCRGQPYSWGRGDGEGS